MAGIAAVVAEAAPVGRRCSGDRRARPSGGPRALDRITPGQAYRATPKATPADARARAHYRLRYDRLDATGKMSFRRAGRMHHLAIGRAHARTRVLALADGEHVTTIELETGEVLSRHLIEPDKTYWRNQNNQPGRWPSSSKRDT